MSEQQRQLLHLVIGGEMKDLTPVLDTIIAHALQWERKLADLRTDA